MKKYIVSSFLTLLLSANVSTAQDRKPELLGARNDEELASAMGHFERARSLLIGAVNEFDKGLKIANPSPLLKTGTWRNTVIDQAAALERVLSPKARKTESGVKFDADTRLLNEAK